jgi:hypothetical protein
MTRSRAALPGGPGDRQAVQRVCGAQHVFQLRIRVCKEISAAETEIADDSCVLLESGGVRAQTLHSEAQHAARVHRAGREGGAGGRCCWSSASKAACTRACSAAATRATFEKQPGPSLR